MGEGSIGIKMKLGNFVHFLYLIIFLEIHQAFHEGFSSLLVFVLAMKSSIS